MCARPQLFIPKKGLHSQQRNYDTIQFVIPMSLFRYVTLWIRQYSFRSFETVIQFVALLLYRSFGSNPINAMMWLYGC